MTQLVVNNTLLINHDDVFLCWNGFVFLKKGRLMCEGPFNPIYSL